MSRTLFAALTQLDSIAHEETIICRQLFAGHVVCSDSQFESFSSFTVYYHNNALPTQIIIYLSDEACGVCVQILHNIHVFASTQLMSFAEFLLTISIIKRK